MNIPEYETLMIPVLQVLAQRGEELEFSQIHDEVAEVDGLPGGFSEELLPSGRGTVFENKLRWALTYLMSAGQVEMTARGRYLISAVGYDVIELLATEVPGTFEAGKLLPGTPVDRASAGGQSRAEPRNREGLSAASADGLAAGEGADLESKIKHFFEIDYQQQKSLLIKRVHGQSPEFFENLIIDLLLAMGYGRRRDDLIARLGKSGDGGVDGVLLEDELGLNRIYFQAKRLNPDVSVPISAVRDLPAVWKASKPIVGYS